MKSLTEENWCRIHTISFTKRIMICTKIILFIALMMTFSLGVFAQEKLDTIKAKKIPNITKKGNVYAGLTFSFNNNKLSETNRLLIYIEDREKKAFNLKLDAGYFIKNNWAVGGLLEYDRTTRQGIEINTQGQRAAINEAKETYGIFGTTKFYIPLEAKHRFYLYNLVLLGGTWQHHVIETTIDDILTRTYIKNQSAELRIVPGMMVHVMNGFSVEAGAEIAGIKSNWSNTTINGEPAGHRTSFSGDLSINLLRLSLGFYFYFPVHTKK